MRSSPTTALATLTLMLAVTPAAADIFEPSLGAPPPAHAASAADPDEILGLDLSPDTCGEVQVANQALGGAIGGVVGGLIGSGIGKGSGRTVATISGAVLGALGGAMLGNKVATVGPACVPQQAAGADDPLFFAPVTR